MARPVSGPGWRLNRMNPVTLGDDNPVNMPSRDYRICDRTFRVRVCHLRRDPILEERRLCGSVWPMGLQGSPRANGVLPTCSNNGPERDCCVQRRVNSPMRREAGLLTPKSRRPRRLKKGNGTRRSIIIRTRSIPRGKEKTAQAAAELHTLRSGPARCLVARPARRPTPRRLSAGGREIRSSRAPR